MEGGLARLPVEEKMLGIAMCPVQHHFQPTRPHTMTTTTKLGPFIFHSDSSIQ